MCEVSIFNHFAAVLEEFELLRDCKLGEKMKQISFQSVGLPIRQFLWMHGLSNSILYRFWLSIYDLYSLPCWSSPHFDPFEGFKESLPCPQVRRALRMIL